jgi:uncharacterized membrane protein
MASGESTGGGAQARAVEIDRLAALTDGVIAIVITLLVLDVAVPQVPDAGLGDALVDLRPQVYGFVLSFAVVGYYWLSHRLVFSHLRTIDGTLTGINLVFLLVIAFIPFAAGLLAEYIPDSLSVAVYAGVMTLAGLSLLAMITYPGTHGHFHPDVDLRHAAATTRRMTIAPIVFLLSVPVAFISGWLAMGLWLLIPLARYAVERRADR